jgi:hypothetical protein
MNTLPATSGDAPLALDARPGTSPLRVLLAFASLAVLAGVVATLALLRTGSVAPESVLAPAFDV